MRMIDHPRRSRAHLIVGGAMLVLLCRVAVAQQDPVAAMFADDQKRHQSHAASFVRIELPSSAGAPTPLQVYLSAGDLERAFDESRFRPDAAIVPTNTALSLAASSPATQRVLVERVQKHPAIMKDLEDQIAARRKQAVAGKDGELVPIGVGTFVAKLSGSATPTDGAFPKTTCLIATEYAKGGAIDRRELLTQDRVRKGIAACLAALDTSGARSVVMPLLGAASSGTQAKDTQYEGQRLLKECRLLNSVAGMALGIHDFASGRRNVRQIGVVQWDQEIVGMFSVPPGSPAAASAQAAYRTYADQIQAALRNGLAGKKTTAADVGGTCNATFNAQ
jgi:hypothetical protein